MKVQLTKPVDHVEVVRNSVQLQELSLEFILITPAENKLTLKVQPINKDIAVSGSDYEAIKSALDKALGKILAPIIEAAVNPPAPAEAAAQS